MASGSIQATESPKVYGCAVVTQNDGGTQTGYGVLGNQVDKRHQIPSFQRQDPQSWR